MSTDLQPKGTKSLPLTPFAAITQRLREKDRLANIERVLPAFCKDQGERIIQRALFYWARNQEVQICTQDSFIKCVIEAAELGFCLDGKLCHAVKFNTKISKRGQPDQWANIAQLIVDYKGLLAVAKRNHVVQDGWAKLVLQGDTFNFTERNGQQMYDYVPDLTLSRDRPDNPLGVLAVATHREGWFRAEFLPIVDVLAIRDQSKGYDPSWQNCPWVKHPGEMMKKTAIKRLLKTFTDDPGIIRALEIDDASETVSANDLEVNTIPSDRASKVIPQTPKGAIAQEPIDVGSEAGDGFGAPLPLEPGEEPRPESPDALDATFDEPAPPVENQDADPPPAPEKPAFAPNTPETLRVVQKYKDLIAEVDSTGKALKLKRRAEDDMNVTNLPSDNRKYVMDLIEGCITVQKQKKAAGPQ